MRIAVFGAGAVGGYFGGRLAHDPALQVRFPDSALWATLVHQPDVLSLLGGWIQVLGDYGFHPTVAKMASSHLRTLLQATEMLIAAYSTVHALAGNRTRS